MWFWKFFPVSANTLATKASTSMYSLQMQNNMYSHQMQNNQVMGYGYGQQRPDSQFLEQQMYGLLVQDDSALRNSSYPIPSSSSHMPLTRPSKPEDKLFGDLVDTAKLKLKPGPGRAGSM